MAYLESQEKIERLRDMRPRTEGRRQLELTNQPLINYWINVPY
jgi:hypothetical protein